jgi:hypothetical protein
LTKLYASGIVVCKEVEMGHTPGPWVVLDQHIIEGGDGFTVARACFDPVADREPFELDDNANLIAAAPELLAAVEAAAAQLDAALRGRRPPLNDIKEYGPMLRAALARARR